MESNEMPVTHTATPEHTQPVNPVAKKAHPSSQGASHLKKGPSGTDA